MRAATIEKFINYEVQNFVAMKLIDLDTNWGCFPRKAVLLLYVKSISLFKEEVTISVTCLETDPWHDSTGT